MAYITLEQRDAVEDLTRTYGGTRAKIEKTSEPYGLVWLDWPDGRLGPRNLFIKPDGTRLSWELLEK